MTTFHYGWDNLELNGLLERKEITMRSRHRMLAAAFCTLLFSASCLAHAAGGSSSLVALAPSGSIWYSNNKTSWVQIPGKLSDLAVCDLNGNSAFDIVGLNSVGKVYYTTNRTSWSSVSGALAKLAVGDFNGDGKDDIAGLSSLGKVYYTTDKGAHWKNIVGALSSLYSGDLNGDGADDLVGLSSSGKIYYTTNRTSWTPMNGILSKLVIGDLNGDGKDDIAGLSSLGKVYYTTDKGAHWTNIVGALSSLTTGDLNGDGKDDLVGLNSVGKIYYTTNKTSWTLMNGILSKLAIGDLNGDGADDVAGLTSLGKVYYTADKGAHWANVPGTFSGLYCNAKVKEGGEPGDMVYIPAGSFLMGNNGIGDEAWYGGSDEFPQHSVTLSGYYIGKYEVTRGEYRAFMNAGGYSTQSYWSSAGWSWKVNAISGEPYTEPEWWAANQDWDGNQPFTQTDNHPVVGVSYYEAEAFCNWAGGHLPTEAQWEKAARWTGSHPNVYPWGDVWDAEKCNNYSDHNSAGGGYWRYQTAPVGSYPQDTPWSGASPYGCQDMAGNVEEWCKDWYGETYYSESPTTDPQGPASGVDRVMRGGSWYGSGVIILRCAYRDYTGPRAGRYCPYIGFRLAR